MPPRLQTAWNCASTLRPKALWTSTACMFIVASTAPTARPHSRKAAKNADLHRCEHREGGADRQAPDGRGEALGAAAAHGDGACGDAAGAGAHRHPEHQRGDGGVADVPAVGVRRQVREQRREGQPLREEARGHEGTTAGEASRPVTIPVHHAVAALCRARSWADERHIDLDELGCARRRRDLQAVVSPRDVDEVARVVRAAGRAGRRVKAVGSGHSFTGAAVTDGVMVRLDRLRRLDVGEGGRSPSVRAGPCTS